MCLHITLISDVCMVHLAELTTQRMQQGLILIWLRNSLACPHVFLSLL